MVGYHLPLTSSVFIPQSNDTIVYRFVVIREIRKHDQDETITRGFATRAGIDVFV